MKTHLIILLLTTFINTTPSNVSNIQAFKKIQVEMATLKLANSIPISSSTDGKNNPFNIRSVKANKWIGKIETTNQFEVFKTKAHGIRAGLKLLQTYHRTYKLNTVSDIIHKYAPTIENNTDLYINTVCNITGFTATQELNLEDMDTLIQLANAMSICEGNEVSIDDLTHVSQKYF